MKEVRKMTSFKRRKRNKVPWRALIRGALFGLLALIVPILLLTLLIYLGWLPESAISVGNTVIKVLAAAVAGVAVGRAKGSWIVGGLAAVLSEAVAIALMSVFLGAFTFSWTLVADLLMSFAIGAAICAVILKFGK